MSVVEVLVERRVVDGSAGRRHLDDTLLQGDRVRDVQTNSRRECPDEHRVPGVDNRLRTVDTGLWCRPRVLELRADRPVGVCLVYLLCNRLCTVTDRRAEVLEATGHTHHQPEVYLTTGFAAVLTTVVVTTDTACESECARHGGCL